VPGGGMGTFSASLKTSPTILNAVSRTLKGILRIEQPLRKIHPTTTKMNMNIFLSTIFLFKDKNKPLVRRGLASDLVY